MDDLREPLIHSFITDGLPEGHPLRNTRVDCTRCGTTVHTDIGGDGGECMETWIETGRGNYCIPCFIFLLDASDDQRALGDDWGLPAS